MDFSDIRKPMIFDKDSELLRGRRAAARISAAIIHSLPPIMGHAGQTKSNRRASLDLMSRCTLTPADRRYPNYEAEMRLKLVLSYSTNIQIRFNGSSACMSAESFS